jgi:hypothetical protein
LAEKASGAAAVCKRELLIMQLFCSFHAAPNIFPFVKPLPKNTVIGVGARAFAQADAQFRRRLTLGWA